MKARAFAAGLVVLLVALGASPLLAQTSDEVERREAELFGQPDEEPDKPEGSANPGEGGEGGEGESKGAEGGDDEESRREAELFGGDEPEPGEGGDASAREDAMFGGDEGGQGVEDRLFGGEGASPLTSESDIDARLSENYDPLDLGGRLFLRLDYASQEEGDPEKFALSSTNFLDLYLDARPNDRVRAYVSARLIYDPTVDEDTPGAFGGTRSEQSVALDKLWLKFDLDRVVYVTAGRQEVCRGAGRFWNPTDFLNPQRLDPLAIFDQRLGVDLLKLHLPIYEWDANLYGIAIISDANAPEKVGVAGCGEILLGDAEVTASAEWRKDAPLRLGGDVSFGFWLLDIRAEGAVRRGDRTPVFEGEFAPERLVFPEQSSRREDWLFQGVIGADMSIAVGDEDSIIIGGEYFYNQGGYADAELYPWLLFNGGFTPLYIGEHYAAVYATAIAPGDWDDTSFVLSTLGNLSDLSFISRFDYRFQALTYLSFNAYVAGHYGKVGEFHLGLELPPIPLVPELAEGLSVSPQFIDAGVSLIVGL